ncbi:MAG: hypothetical protein V4733_06170 [Verrucomicrobiota bacterium]
MSVAGWANAEVEDPGRREIGKLDVRVFHATDAKPAVDGTPADGTLVKRFQSEKRLRFKHYRVLGRDVQPLFQSYENWAQPLKPSNEILVRFEAQGHPTANSAVVDLELWISRKKTVKTDATLRGGRPLFVLGPEWRGGRLIISVALADRSDKVAK